MKKQTISIVTILVLLGAFTVQAQNAANQSAQTPSTKTETGKSNAQMAHTSTANAKKKQGLSTAAPKKSTGKKASQNNGGLIK